MYREILSRKIRPYECGGSGLPAESAVAAGCQFRCRARRRASSERRYGIRFAHEIPRCEGRRLVQYLVNRSHWRLHGHRPAHLSGFSQLVVETCRSSQPEVLLATGIAPIESADLRAIRGLGIRTCNYLTDDPFNPAHRAPWFLEVLPEYDCIFSPRHANIADLRVAGCGNVVYMPFAYAPEIHFPEQPADASERSRFGSDVFFAGGADKSRIPYMAALIREGFKVALYGGYWDRYRETRASHLGFADPTTARKAAAAATVSVCLVRRANRDGHSMRSFDSRPCARAWLWKIRQIIGRVRPGRVRRLFSICRRTA